MSRSRNPSAVFNVVFPMASETNADLAEVVRALANNIDAADPMWFELGKLLDVQDDVQDHFLHPRLCEEGKLYHHQELHFSFKLKKLSDELHELSKYVTCVQVCFDKMADTSSPIQ